MVNSFKEIDNNLINDICNYFEKDYSFDSLREKYPFLDYNVLYSILYSTGNYSENIYDCLCQQNIDDNKILLISDTHYGSIYENLRYTYDVFDFAVANSIRVVLHGGDILEASVKPKKGYNIIKQANHFINTYPFDSSIVTYALLGNHDYLAINKKEIIRNILSSRDDITILGFKKAYLKWFQNVISLQHEIENYKLNLPMNAEYISFKGHSHFYHIREKKKGKNERIYIPAMCDDPNCCKFTKDGILRPGFLTAEIDNGNIIVINYSFTSSGIVKENEFKKVLKKKII